MKENKAGIEAVRVVGRGARKTYRFRPAPELSSGKPGHYPVVIVGGGPIGLALALSLDQLGISSVILEKCDSIGEGSRAICWAKRTLEILDRIGVGDPVHEAGVTWNVGKVYYRDDPEPLYIFDLLPVKAQKYPAFVNLQQYFTEQFLVDRVTERELCDLRWSSEVTAIESNPDGVSITVGTPRGSYRLLCDYLIAADGHRSSIRHMLGLDFEGRLFEDNFLIADIRMKSDLPAERRFWFDPPFNPGQTALLHKQADDVWRMDFQLGWDIDHETVLNDRHIDERIRACLGANVEFEYEWVSIYTFQCRRMSKFVHDRVIFAGDSAHLVSPFGARGANGGLQDVDNLAWKLALTLEGKAPERLLESYDVERGQGADENLLNSSRSTDFMTPKSAVSRAFRDATLELARDFEFARHFVNSGRLSMPCTLEDSPLNTPDTDRFSEVQRPGSPCLDAPVEANGDKRWLLNHLGDRFVGLYFAGPGDGRSAEIATLANAPIPVEILVVGNAQTPDVSVRDHAGLAFQRYDARPGTFYLVRPDQHVAGRWRSFDRTAVMRALDRATGRAP